MPKHSSPGGRHLRELDDLVVARIVAGGVGEPDGEPEGAGLHRFANRGLHAGQLVICRGAVLEAHGIDAHRSMADHGHEVGGDVEVLQLAQVLVEGAPAPGQHAVHRCLEGHVGLEQVEGVGIDRCRRLAALSRALGGDALAQLEVPRVVRVEDREVGVAVHVDEPGRHVESVGIDDPIGLAFDPADGCNRAVLHPDIGAKPGIAGAVDDTAVPESAGRT